MYAAAEVEWLAEECQEELPGTAATMLGMTHPLLMTLFHVQYHSNATSHSLKTFCSTHARTRHLPSLVFKFAAQKSLYTWFTIKSL